MSTAAAPMRSDLPSPKIGVRLLIFLSFATLGIHPAFWALNRTRELNEAGHGQHTHPALPWALVVVAVVTAPHVFIALPREYQSLTLATDIAYFLLLYWNVFTIRKKLMTASQSISMAYTVLFGHWYLQYKINQTKA